MSSFLSIKDLTVEVEGKEILKEVFLDLNKGQTVALVGPNGSGKSTFALTIMGHPKFKIIKGEILFEGQPIQFLSPSERAKKGIFLSFQNPIEIPGVPLGRFLWNVFNYSKSKIALKDFMKLLEEKCEMLKIDKSFTERAINYGFSGGEKKKAEILQLAVLEPKLAILDETDSGLDQESIGTVADAIKKIKKDNPEMTLIVISHYEKFLQLLSPETVLNMNVQGKIGILA